MTDIDGDTGAVGGGCLEDYEIIKPIGKGEMFLRNEEDHNFACEEFKV